MFSELLINIFWAVAFFLIFYGMGALVLRHLWRNEASTAEHLAISTILGVSVFSILLLGLSRVGLYQPVAIGSLLIIAAVISLGTIIKRHLANRLWSRVRNVFREDPWLVAPLALLTIVEFVHSWLPNTAPDAYHYELPLIWLRHGSMHDTGATVYDGFTHAIHLVYGAGLAVGGDAAANKVALIALIVSLLGCVAMARAAGWSRRVGLYAACAVAAIHSFPAEAHGGWVDIHVLMFVVAAGVFGLRWLRENGTANLVLLGAMLGLAGGTKQNGWLAAGCLILAFGIAGIICKGSRKTLRAWPWAIVAFIAIGGPWLYWSYQVTGNPLYPAFNSFFGAVGHGFSGWAEEATRRGLERNIFTYVSYPWRLSMDFELLRESWAYGIGPALIAFTPLALFYRQRGIAVVASALFLFAYLSAMFFFAPHMVRYIFPAFAFAALLAGNAAYTFTKRHSGRRLRTGITLMIALPVLLATTIEAARLVPTGARRYITRAISASEYRKQHHNYRGHALVLRANEMLSENSKVLLLSVNGLGLERNYVSSRRFFAETVAESEFSRAEMLEAVRAAEITHLLARVKPKALALAALSNIPMEAWQDQEISPPIPPGYSPEEIQDEIEAAKQDPASAKETLEGTFSQQQEAKLLLALADDLRLIHAADTVDHGFIYAIDTSKGEAG